MKQFIYDTLIELHKNVITDKFGQINKCNFQPSIFGDKSKEVETYCNENGILEFSVYGYKYFTYRAFTIQDNELKIKCNNALRTNPNYIKNINAL